MGQGTSRHAHSDNKAPGTAQKRKRKGGKRSSRPVVPHFECLCFGGGNRDSAD